MKKKGNLKINLQSDLCMGSGLSYAGVIDQDVVYDEDGFPYIPARRLKGCLREAAALFADQERTDVLLGKAGQSAPGRVYIENAALTDTALLREQIRQAKREEAVRPHLRTEDILSLYTSVRAQTAIDEKTGTAKKNTLRMTRVVNRHNPLTSEQEEPLCFVADVYYEDQDGETVHFLEKAAKALRHIGMDRNRGLGNVRCSFCGDTGIVQSGTEAVSGKDLVRVASSGNLVRISYALKNREPLMLSDLDKDSTVSYISARSIIGALAAAYLRMREDDGEKKSADTEEFADLFLNGKVKFYNANLAISGLRSQPAPLYINCLKKTKKYVNILDNEENKNAVSKADEAYNWEQGNQPKKLKTQYITFSKEKGTLSCRVSEPERELSFHHRHEHGDEAPDAILYSQEALSVGQIFVGMIDAPIEYEELLLELLENADFRFGKSRNAQYGACELILCKQKPLMEERFFSAGEAVVVTLCSDGIFVNDDDAVTVQFDEVKKILARQLGITAQELTDEKSMMETTVVTGYHTKWNRKRDAVAAVKAGSAFVYTLAKNWNWSLSFVGERNQEGFGEISVESMDQMKFQINVKVEESDIDQNENDAGSKISAPLPEELQIALCRILYPKLVRRLVETELMEKKKGASITASGIGRVTLMMKECSDQYADEDELATELMRRIDSIKTDSTRREAKRMIPCVKDAEETGQGDKKQYQVNIEELVNIACGGSENSQDAEEDGKAPTDEAGDSGWNFLRKGKYLSQDRKKDLCKKAWRDWVLQSLALKKYGKKGE